MSQNRSSAVMAQRAEPHDSLDFFPTPPWATRALFEHAIGAQRTHRGWDPACGDGAMYRPMCEYMLACAASDVHDYGWGHSVHDFLQPFTPDGIAEAEWIITNPPFRLAEQFARRALALATHGVAMLVRSVFIESIGRYQGLFRETPPTVMAQFTERVAMVKGRLDQNASSATAYCWLVWKNGAGNSSRLAWIPPCRATLERDSDYPLGEAA